MNTDELGFVATPPPVADWMAAETFLRPPTEGDRILYPGAGGGNLAAAIHRRCSVRGVPAPDATFVERDPGRAATLSERFVGDDAPMNNGVPEQSAESVEWHTPLRSQPKTAAVHADVEIAETDVLLDPPDGPFNYIVMNPPYTAYPHIATEDREAYADRFHSAAGQFPLYAPFIEQALDLLADNGTCTFLAPDSYLSLSTTAPLRWRVRQANVATPLLVPEFAFDEMVQTVITTATPRGSGLLAPAMSPDERSFTLTPLGGRPVSLLFERFGHSGEAGQAAIREYFETTRAASQRVRNNSQRDLDDGAPAWVGDDLETGTACTDGRQTTLDASWG